MIFSMTDNQAEHAFRLMWLELAETGNVFKSRTKIMKSIRALKLHPDIYMDRDLNHSYHASCFACGEEEARERQTGNYNPDCSKFCPIKWPGGGSCMQSIFKEWDVCKYREQRKLLAAQIARLPWKKRGKK